MHILTDKYSHGSHIINKDNYSNNIVDLKKNLKCTQFLFLFGFLLIDIIICVYYNRLQKNIV